LSLRVLARASFLRQGALFAIAGLAVFVWIANTWSPSSYGIVLQSFGVRDTGIVLGEPRAVRTDEWAILTPLIQATVNNGRQRTNATSFYREDLRMPLALPVADWGLAFKPDQWLYPFFNAAYAYSFQHAVYIVAFLAGYALFFRRAGIGPATAALLSGALFFTAYVQFWWTTFAPDLAYFSWLLVTLSISRPVLRAVAFFWVAVVWLLGYFYPPIFIPLAVAAAAVYWSLYFPRRGIRGAVVDGVVALAACTVVVFYHQDFIATTWDSIYPGLRRLRGGNVSLAQQLQTFWPTAYLDGFDTTIPGRNVCEASVVGTYYFLFAAAFVDFRRLTAEAIPRQTRRLLTAALAAFALLLAWQNLPIPASVGRWILFDRVQPVRTLFVSGFLLLLAAATVVQIGALRFSKLRVAAFCLAVLAGWSLTKGFTRGLTAIPWVDIAVLPVALAVWFFGSHFRGYGAAAIAGGSALLGLIAFAPFNPIQSAWPIFNRESTDVSRALDDMQKRNPQGALVIDQFGGTLLSWGFGATLNGWGYRSVAHSLLTPQLALWRALFPEMPDVARNKVFNRMGEVVVRDVQVPTLLAVNIMAVPRRAFHETTRPWFAIEPLKEFDGAPARGGSLDERRVDGRRLSLNGWAPWHGLHPGQTLSLYASAPLAVVSAWRYARGDVALVLRDESLHFTGFMVEAESVGDAPLPSDLTICVVAGGPGDAARTLIEPADPACTTLLR